MADHHKKEIQEVLERAREAPTLLEALEILFTAHCCENSPKVASRLSWSIFTRKLRVIPEWQTWSGTFCKPPWTGSPI